MALTLNNFTGFETQGSEELKTRFGTPNFSTSVAHEGGGSASYEPSNGDSGIGLSWVADGITDAGTAWVVGFALRKAADVSSDSIIASVLDDNNNPNDALVDWQLLADGTLRLLDNAGSAKGTSSALDDDTWYFVELYCDFNNASGSYEWFIDGSSVSSGTGDFTNGAGFGSATSEFTMRLPSQDSTTAIYFDDAYILSGATAATDRYGDFVVKAYQNTAAGATDNGDELDNGTWALVSETPLNAGTSNDAFYDGTGGSWAGDTTTDGGSRSGPSGDADVSGATIKGAKFIWHLKRGSGKAHTSMWGRYGNSGDGTTDTSDLGLTTVYANYFLLSEAAGVVPTSSEYFRIGFGATGNGAQDIICGDQWAMLGFVPAAAFTPVANAYRFYEDGTESGSTPIDSEDTNVSIEVDGANAQAHLRIRVDETGGSGGASTDDYGLEYSKNSGAWTAVTASSSNVQADTGSSLTDGSATTNRATNGISDPGAGSFVAGEQEEANGVIEDVQLTASNFTELVWALLIIDADTANGDTLDFRVTLNAGSPGMTNNVTPRITVTAPTAGIGWVPDGVGGWW